MCRFLLYCKVLHILNPTNTPWHGNSIVLYRMVRITIRKEASRAVVVIDGRLASADLEELQRVRQTLTGSVVLDLGGMLGCADDGIRVLRDWLGSGALVVNAAPFLRMLLEPGNKESSVKESQAIHKMPPSLHHFCS